MYIFIKNASFMRSHSLTVFGRHRLSRGSGFEAGVVLFFSREGFLKIHDFFIAFILIYQRQFKKWNCKSYKKKEKRTNELFCRWEYRQKKESASGPPLTVLLLIPGHRIRLGGFGVPQLLPAFLRCLRHCLHRCPRRSPRRYRFLSRRRPLF